MRFVIYTSSKYIDFRKISFIDMTPAPLTTYCDGCELKIYSVYGTLQKRLREMGLREGACVKMVKNSEDLIVRLDGCRIGLCRDTAANILAIPTSA